MIIDRPSPNFGPRPLNMAPSHIVLHGTAGRSDAGDVAWCRKSQADHDADYTAAIKKWTEGGKKGAAPREYDAVSYHYIVGRDGSIYRLVDDLKRAWHAGKSEWDGRRDCNNFSIGVAISGTDDEPFTDAQYRSTGKLLFLLSDRWTIPLQNIVGHQHVSPTRKTDPWLHCHWMRLAQEMVT